MVERLVFWGVLGWCGLAALLAAGLVGLAGAVEGARLGVYGALLVAVSSAPAALSLLSPTLAAVGASAAAARMEVRGERLALDASGVHPGRAMLAALLAGALLGGAQRLVSDHVVWRAVSAREAVHPTHEGDWVWLEGGAYRASDAVWVGADLSIMHDRAVSHAELQEARMNQSVRTAPGHLVRSAGSAATRLEDHNRRARGLVCALFAAVCWLPAGASGLVGLRKVGVALSLALVWQALDAVVYAAAAQGQLSGVIGGWAATGVLGVTVAVLVLRQLR